MLNDNAAKCFCVVDSHIHCRNSAVDDVHSARHNHATDKLYTFVLWLDIYFVGVYPEMKVILNPNHCFLMQ